MVTLSLLTDEDKEKRQKGVALIKEAREIKKSKDPAEIRYFLKPEKHQVDIEAEDYSNFLLYDEVEKTEPPATFSLSEEELEAIGEGTFLGLYLHQYYIQDHNFKRTIKLIDFSQKNCVFVLQFQLEHNMF